MIDLKLLRSDPEAVARNMARRGITLDVQALRALEEKRKPWQVETDRLRAERNANAKAVGMAKGKGQDVSPLIARGEVLTAELARAEQALSAVQVELDQWQMELPNLLHDSVPDGADEKSNVEVRRWGKPRTFEFEPRDHVAIGELLGGLDFEAAARMSGSRFVVMRSQVARLPLAQRQARAQAELLRVFRSAKIDSILLRTDQPYASALGRFFETREKRRLHG